MVLGRVSRGVGKREHPVSQLVTEGDLLFPARPAERRARTRADPACDASDVSRVVEEAADTILERRRQIERDLIHWSAAGEGQQLTDRVVEA